MNKLIETIKMIITRGEEILGKMADKLVSMETSLINIMPFNNNVERSVNTAGTNSISTEKVKTTRDYIEDYVFADTDTEKRFALSKIDNDFPFRGQYK